MQIESTHLGKESKYPQHYDPSVLVAVPRILNREKYGITNGNLPFSGVDVWHAYEFSFLLKFGAPVVGILKIIYSSNNEYLVESKSLKLYLNSFNMENYGKSKEEGINEVTAIIKKDLSVLLGCDVGVYYFIDNLSNSYDFSDFTILENEIFFNDIVCNEYFESPDLLMNSEQSGSIKWGTHLLRSNCKVTLQPDWGSLFIEMSGNILPEPASFLKYIISLRNENHFHEEICEMIFKRIKDKFEPEDLIITCLYTRRGGIDICPVRSINGIFPIHLTSNAYISKPAFRQ